MVSKLTSFIFEENFWKLDEFHGGDTDSVCSLGGSSGGGGACVLTLEAGSFMTEPPPPPFFSVVDRVGNLSLREMRDTILLRPQT